jgi:hypothetical protein
MISLSAVLRSRVASRSQPQHPVGIAKHRPPGRLEERKGQRNTPIWQNIALFQTTSSQHSAYMTAKDDEMQI